MEQQQQQVARTWKGEGEQNQRGGVFDSLLRGVGAENMTIDQCEAIRKLDDDSHLIGAPVTVSADVAAKVESAVTVDVQVGNAGAVVPDISVVKKRRGRPPQNQAKVAPRTTTKEMEEEDVCFICFDGGSLVLCDRRGCPKAYHPACIKRDDAFFQSNAKWNCGWHICSSCEKASHFMCYTCPYSLCKGCAKFADYLCVRGNKGFCRSCMKMIMLIENVPAENSEQVQVDFDDNTSWEYLFKVYWVCLKESLLLTVEEILKSKSSGQVDELPKTRSPWKVSAVMDPVSESSSELCYGRDDKATSSSTSYGSLDTNYCKRRKYDVEPKVLSDEASVGTEKSSVSKVAPMPEGTKWATKELLELVAHVRNGDASFLCQSEVQVLLLEYIRRNNLRDPRRKCQILCDTRLINLFGKTRVGHIEMVKLLEYHLLVKENPSHDESVMVDIAVADAGTAAAERSCTEVPFAHSDPNMGPHCKSEGNIKEAKNHITLNHEGMGSSSHGQNISAVSSVMHFPPPTTEGVISNNDELQRLWHYRDPFGTVQGPFPMVQLRNWSTSGLFPLDLRVWMMNGKEEESVLLTDALLRSFHKEIITDRSDKDSKWNCASSQDTATTHMDENIVHQNGQPEKKDSSSTDVGNGEVTSSEVLGSRSSRLTMLLDLVIGSNELDKNSEQLCDLSKNSNSGGNQSQIYDPVASPSTSAKVCDVEMLHVTPVGGEENKSTSVNDVMRIPHRTNPKEQTVGEDGDGNEVKTEGCSSQSSGQSWHPTHMNISYGWDLNSTFPSMVNSNGAVKNEQEVSFSEVKHDNGESKGQSGEQKYSVSCNVSIIDAGPSWSTTSSLVGGARLPDVAAEWTGYSSVPAKPSVEDWGSNLVSASSFRPPNGSSGHASIPTSGAGELRHSSLSHGSIDTTGWQAMVSEPNDFSLVDESVSDLLAEVEAMESLGGFLSPTSKLSCVGDLMHVSDNDCFSPVENFSPALPRGRSAALSSAGDIEMPSRLSVAEEQLDLSIMPSQPIVPRDSLEKTQKPPQLTVTEPFHTSRNK